MEGDMLSIRAFVKWDRGFFAKWKVSLWVPLVCAHEKAFLLKNRGSVTWPWSCSVTYSIYSAFRIVKFQGTLQASATMLPTYLLYTKSMQFNRILLRCANILQSHKFSSSAFKQELSFARNCRTSNQQDLSIPKALVHMLSVHYKTDFVNHIEMRPWNSVRMLLGHHT